MYCWAMSIHMKVCWQPNLNLESPTRINRWLRFASNDWGASLRRYKKKTLPTLGSCECVRQTRASQDVAAAVRGWETTLEYHNQVRRWGEEGEVNLSRFLRYDWFVFKLVVGGSTVLGLAPNLVSLFLTLSTSIRLHSLGFGSVEVLIWEQFF
jgi:hypothetical protein